MSKVNSACGCHWAVEVVVSPAGMLPRALGAGVDPDVHRQLLCIFLKYQQAVCVPLLYSAWPYILLA